MKINWGTGIVIAFVFFISFIMFFVIKMSTNKKYTHDLVTKDYYKQELKYQAAIDKEKNGQDLINNIEFKIIDQGVVIVFPKEMDVHEISGKVFLYRPSNKQLDFEIPISLSTHNLLIPDKRLLDGRWNITVDWKHYKKPYLYKQEITY